MPSTIIENLRDLSGPLKLNNNNRQAKFIVLKTLCKGAGVKFNFECVANLDNFEKKKIDFIYKEKRFLLFFDDDFVTLINKDDAMSQVILYEYHALDFVHNQEEKIVESNSTFKAVVLLYQEILKKFVISL